MVHCLDISYVTPALQINDVFSVRHVCQHLTLTYVITVYYVFFSNYYRHWRVSVVYNVCVYVNTSQDMSNIVNKRHMVT